MLLDKRWILVRFFAVIWMCIVSDELIPARPLRHDSSWDGSRGCWGTVGPVHWGVGSCVAVHWLSHVHGVLMNSVTSSTMCLCKTCVVCIDLLNLCPAVHMQKYLESFVVFAWLSAGESNFALLLRSIIAAIYHNSFFNLCIWLDCNCRCPPCWGVTCSKTGGRYML